MVLCDNQEEIDYFWNKLSYVPEAEQCGWVKDKFGLSWQIVPNHMNEILMNGTQEEVKRVTEAFLKMKKFDLQALEKARLG
jgi:predicted 3-demethylubiquinone-9 3-methyltransferase (glyoxalase superfamily)